MKRKQEIPNNQEQAHGIEKEVQLSKDKEFPEH